MKHTITKGTHTELTINNLMKKHCLQGKFCLVDTPTETTGHLLIGKSTYLAVSITLLLKHLNLHPHFDPIALSHHDQSEPFTRKPDAIYQIKMYTAAAFFRCGLLTFLQALINDQRFRWKFRQSASTTSFDIYRPAHTKTTLALSLFFSFLPFSSSSSYTPTSLSKQKASK